MTTTAFATVWSSQAPYQTALEALQRLHWSVFPLDEEKRPPVLGATHPDGTPKRLAWKRFQSRHATPAQLQQWQRQFAPSAWAVITGAISGVIILDFDIPDGEELRKRLGLEPHVLTGSGGAHVYFRHPGWSVSTLNSKSTPELGRRWPGLDIRADGGCGTFCGRSHLGPYRWVRDPVPDELDLLPKELREFLGLLHPPVPREESTPKQNMIAVTPDKTLATALLKRALQMVKDGNGRNDTGFWLACQLRDNQFSREQAEKVLAQYAGQVPETNSKQQRDPYRVEEALASVRSAYTNQKEERTPWNLATAPQPASGGRGRRGNDRAHRVAVAQDTPPPEEAGLKGGNISSDAPNSLPDIIIGDSQLRDMTDEAVASLVLHEQDAPTLFMQSSRLVRVGHNELKQPFVASMGTTEVKEILTHAANYYRLKKVSGAEGEEYRKIPIPPPKEIAEQILARQTQRPYLPFPALQAIVETPVIRPDGSILETPGYDSSTRLYYAPHPGLAVCPVPLTPTPAEREAALALIWETIGEFPYVSDADRANALGLLFTPILRAAIKRHVPLALLDAPKPGSGKGLFADVVSLIATGGCAAILTAPDNDEEWDKRITAMLMQGRTIICIDNIASRLQSAKLDAVLTADIHEGRILGQSTMIKVPNRATWLATGNNIKIGGDLARRCYRIRFDPHVSRPWMRQGFKHEDLATWVSEQRGALIGALLTLARAWYTAGQPIAEGLPSLGTFTGWVRLIGSILAYAGVEGFLSNLEQLYEDIDEESVQWERFLAVWGDLFHEEWITTQHVIAQLDGDSADSVEGDADSSLVNALPEALAFAWKLKPRSFAIVLGKALEKRVGTCYGEKNMHLERSIDTHTKHKLWRRVADSADSADSDSSAHGKNTDNGDKEKNKYSNGWEHYPHYPQPEMSHVSSNGSTGSSMLQTQSRETSPTLSAKDQLSAKNDESEEFTL